MSPESLVWKYHDQRWKAVLDFQSERHTVLSTNVANVDTPGYKGHDVRFSDELKRAIDTEGTIPLKKTNEKHFP